MILLANCALALSFTINLIYFNERHELSVWEMPACTKVDGESEENRNADGNI
jgi:hypothetical protein